MKQNYEQQNNQKERLVDFWNWSNVPPLEVLKEAYFLITPPLDRLIL